MPLGPGAQVLIMGRDRDPSADARWQDASDSSFADLLAADGGPFKRIRASLRPMAGVIAGFSEQPLAEMPVGC